MSDDQATKQQDLSKTARWPYSPSEYVRRLFWEFVQATLIRWSPRRAYRFRRAILRMFGAKIGRHASIRPTTRVTFPWLLTMGDHSIIADRVTVYNLGPITIGSNTTISQNAHLCAGTHDHTKLDLPLIRATITIGDGVWVCADAFIGPDVTVGDRSLVAARAVVVRDVPPGMIVGGNPAKVLKEREITSNQDGMD